MSYEELPPRKKLVEKTKKETVEETTTVKDDKEIDTLLDHIDHKMQVQHKTTPPVVEEIEKVQEQTIETLLKEFTENLPMWINKPWMYVKPTHESHLKNWYTSWKKLIVSYSKTLAEHVINLYDLQSTHPFTNEEIGKDLSHEELVDIIEMMVEENLARWLDKSTRVRIFYKSDQEWAQIIYEYSIEHGYAAEVMTLFELKKLGQEWSSLPKEELRIIFSVLESQGKIKWVDNDSLEFII